MSMSHDCEELLHALPPLPESAQKVVCTLSDAEPLTGKDLRDRTGLPRRTLYTALQKLRALGVIQERTSLRDSRQSYYWLAETPMQPPLGHERPLHPYAEWSRKALGEAT